jgi:hypothetical protein
MSTNRPAHKIGVSFEYFLYAAIIAETGLAAFVYKIIFRDPDLARFNLYFGIFYAAFLTWSIVQLNNVHKRRKALEGEGAEIKDPVAEPEHTRPALGLTLAQLVIVVVVFVTALVTFSLALRLLR